MTQVSEEREDHEVRGNFTQRGDGDTGGDVGVDPTGPGIFKLVLVNDLV